MKEIHLWNFILSHLSQNKQVVLACVLDHQKGSPGKRSFKLAVSSSGDSIGSIGGGVMEYNIIKECKNSLLNKIPLKKIETLYHNRKAKGKKSGLICAGSQTNFIITLGKENLATIEKITDSLKYYKPGKIIFTNYGIFFKKSPQSTGNSVFKYINENDWSYEQPVCMKNIAHVIGGGHVGLAVCKVMSQLDFFVVVYDSRKDLPTVKENSYADKKIIGPYSNLGSIINEGTDNFIVIVTTGFESDKEALEQLINKEVGYIGLMGTKAKIKKIFNEAVKDGIKKDLLKKVHAPVGIDINSDTPEEIAISIAAEIIKEKNK